MTDGEESFLCNYLSPNSGERSFSQVRAPDGTTRVTYSHTKQWSTDLAPDANHNVVVLMLPFVEAPFAILDTATNIITAIKDPNLTSRTYFSDHQIYGFRHLAQAFTVYNTTPELSKGGQVSAVIAPPCIDTKVFPKVGGSFPFGYQRVLDGIPASVDEITSAAPRVYSGMAKDGIYLVNRSQDGFKWHYRDSDMEKAIYYSLDSDGEPIADPTENSLQYTLAAQTNPANILFDGASLGVTGSSGSGMGLGVAWFSGLDPSSTFSLKMIHTIEMMPKFRSDLIPQCAMGLPHNDTLLRFLDDFVRTQPYAYPARDNFIGTILSAAAKAAPILLPIAEKVGPEIWKYIKKKLDNSPPPSGAKTNPSNVQILLPESSSFPKSRGGGQVTITRPARVRRK